VSIFNDVIHDAGYAAACNASLGMTYVTWWVGGTWLAATVLPRKYWCLQKKCKKQLFYFSTFANKINAKRSIYFTFILFYVRCADGTSLALYKIRNMAEFKPLLGRPSIIPDPVLTASVPLALPRARRQHSLPPNSLVPTHLDHHSWINGH